MIAECIHCRRVKAISGRGLCSSCYLDLAIRNSYAKGKAQGYRSGFGVKGSAKLADCPTTAKPGSEAKILCMQERAQANRAIFHPLDEQRKLA